MRLHRIAGVLAAVLAAGCADCGGGGGPDGGTDDAGLPPSALCQTLAERQCDFFVRCHADPFSPLSGFTVTDAGFTNVVPESERARCVAALSSAVECQAVVASLETGRAGFNETAFRACVDTAYPEDTCDRDALLALSRCRDLSFLQGQVETGGACAFDEDCAGGGFCTGEGPESCGVCEPASAVTGAPCTRDAQCDPASHYCTGGDGSAGSCQPYTAEGEVCSLDDLQQEECGSGRVCALVGIGGGRCEQARREGDPCDLNRFQCLRSGRLNFELACAPVEPEGGGAPVNRCVRTQAPRDGACGNGEGQSFGIAAPICPESQYCVDERCVDRKGASEPCADSAECGFGLRCLPAPGGGQPTCEPYSGLEEVCGTDSDCQALLGCEDGCRPRLALLGEPCGATRGCADGTCEGGECVPKRADDAACGADAECASGLCATTCEDACWD